MREHARTHDRPARANRRIPGRRLATGVLLALLAAGFVLASAGSAGADDALPPPPIPLPVDVPPLPLPAPPDSAPTSGDSAAPALPDAPTAPDGVPSPTGGLPTPDAADSEAPLPGGSDPTGALAPFTDTVVPAVEEFAASGDPEPVCDAISSTATIAFLAAVGIAPPEVTSAAVPLVARVTNGGGTQDAGKLCETLTGGTDPSTGGSNGRTVRTVAATAGGSGSPSAAPTAADPAGGSGGSTASLAFTGSATALLALAGLVLVLSGGVLLGLRRFGRRVA